MRFLRILAHAIVSLNSQKIGDICCHHSGDYEDYPLLRYKFNPSRIKDATISKEPLASTFMQKKTEC